MRVLLTGATGFLGRKVAAALAKSHAVFAITRGGHLPSGVQAVEADLTSDLGEVALPTVDVVGHLAQARDYANFPSSANSVFSVAAKTAQHLLHHAAKTGARRFVYASTGGVYAPSSHARAETDRVELTPGALMHYFASKRSGELVCQAYSSELETVVGRVFFCYGPGQSDQMLFPRLIRSVRTGQPIRLAGNSGLTFNPIHVDDAAACFVHMMERGGEGVMNIAGPKAVTLRTVVDAIGTGMSTDPVFDVVANETGPNLAADVSLLQSSLDRDWVDPIVGACEMAKADHDLL